MFNAGCIPTCARVVRALTPVKDAADIALAFQAHRIVGECISDGCDTVMLVSKDAAFEEVRAQLDLAYPEMRFVLVSNPDELLPFTCTTARR
jgi:hypothetical protein